MTDLFYQIIVALFNAVTSIAINDYFYTIFTSRNDKHKMLVVACLVAFFMSPLVFGKTIIDTLFLFTIPFILTFNYDFKFYNRLLFGILFLVINVLAEAITMYTLSVTFQTDTKTVMTGIWLVFGAIISKMLCLIICFAIGIFKKEILVGKFSFNWLALYSLPLATYIVIFALFQSSYSYGTNAFLRTVSLVGGILLVFSNLFIFKLVNDIHKTAVNEQKLKMSEELVRQQESRYSLLFENNEKLAKQRHDYKNLILGLASQLKHGEYEEVNERIDKELQALSAPSGDVTGNSVVDTLIGYKTAQAQRMGVAINFEYRNISSMSVSGIDLAVLLGNAIDNAVEAASLLSDNSKKTVDVFAVVNNGRLIITVSNNVNEDIDVSNLKSTKPDAHLHGFGIINMRAVAEKYKGDVTFACENKVFRTIISVDNL